MEEKFVKYSRNNPMKLCPKCDVVKNRGNDFNTNASMCKECVKEYNKGYHERKVVDATKILRDEIDELKQKVGELEQLNKKLTKFISAMHKDEWSFYTGDNNKKL